MADMKEMLQEKLRHEFGFAPKKKEITINHIDGGTVEFLVNGYWYKLDDDGFIRR